MIAHARQSVLAAWQLVVRDPKAWDAFDLSADGFFRSFAAILFVIPFNIVFGIPLYLAAAKALCGGS